MNLFSGGTINDLIYCNAMFGKWMKYLVFDSVWSCTENKNCWKFNVAKYTAWIVFVFGVILSKYEKIRTRITPNTNNFDAVILMTGSGAKRNSHDRCSVEKGVLKNFINFRGEHMSSSFFLIKLHVEFLFNKAAGLRPATLLKRDSNACVFLWNLRNFLRTFILKNICERLLL